MYEIQNIKRMVENRKDNMKLAGNTFFLDDKTILSYPREDGDNRYPLKVDGYTAWTYASGYIHVREGGFYSLSWRQDGEDPDIDFFGGLIDQDGRYDYFSLLGVPVDMPNKKIERYTVFTPTATYYFTKYKQIEFCVRIHLAKERTLFATVYVENNSNYKCEILLSSYFDPFLRKKDSKHYDDRWTEETHIVDSKVNNLFDAISVYRGANTYSLIQGQMTPEPKQYYTTASRDVYVGGKNRSLANNLSLSTGKFNKNMPNCFGINNSVFGDIRIISLEPKEHSRTDIRFKVFADKIPKNEHEYQLISDVIDKELEEQIHFRIESDNILKIKFGKSTDNDIDSEVFNCFIENLKRQTEFNSTGKYYAWSELLGIRDVWQQLEPTLLWKTTEFRRLALELLSFTENNGRLPRQIGPAVLNYPMSFDLRKYIDQGVWLLTTLNLYLKYTGDKELFNEVCGYYEYPKGKVYIIDKGAYKSSEKDSVAEHLIRILDYLLSNRDNKTGCIRMLTGDWNDALHFRTSNDDLIDDYGSEVSVMASLQVYSGIKDVVEILQTVNLEKYAPKIEHYKKQREILGEAIRREAVIGNESGELRIVHGWNSNKKVLVGSFCDGDGKNRTALTVQAFGILSGFIEIMPELKDSIIDSFKRLDSEYGFKTFDEYFDSSFEEIIGINGQVPGTHENATAYIHASTFATYALYKIGECTFGWEQFKKLIPTTHKFISHSPYVMPNSYMKNEDFGIDGHSVNDWMTGSAPVILKTIIFSICGYQPMLDGIVIAPANEIPFEDFNFTLKTPEYNLNISYKKQDNGKRNFYLNGSLYEADYDKNLKTVKIFIPTEVLKENDIIDIEIL